MLKVRKVTKKVRKIIESMKNHKTYEKSGKMREIIKSSKNSIFLTLKNPAYNFFDFF